jgi:L-2-amino-thiazoline-4-carboxylic acid hydrolase
MDEPTNFVDFSTINKLTLLEQVKLQAQVVVPLLRAFRKELGSERANAIAYRALDEWSRGLFHQLSKGMGKGSLETWTAMMASSGQRIGSDVDFQMVRQDPQAMEFNITGCRYADFFRALGKPELGALMLCEADFHMLEMSGGEVELQRTQTIMKGGDYCDFRYKMKTSS